MEYSQFNRFKARTSFGDIAYRRNKGTGIPVVFLHGLGGTSQVWSRLLAYLPDYLDIYLVDMLGHGDSDAPHIEYSATTVTKSFEEFVAAVGLEGFCLFGHSYGGWISAYYASTHKVRALILEDSAGLKEEFDSIVQRNKVDDYKKVLYTAAMQINNNKDYVIKSIIDCDFRKDQLDAKTLSKIFSPTLILWGQDDKLVSQWYAFLFQKLISNSSVNIIKGAGHEPHYQQPSEIATQIMDIIAKE